MSTQPSSSPTPEVPPASGLFPATIPPSIAAESDPTVGAAPPGGARKLSRWEEHEELWFPEPTDFSHSGINE